MQKKIRNEKELEEKKGWEGNGMDRRVGRKGKGVLERMGRNEKEET